MSEQTRALLATILALPIKERREIIGAVRESVETTDEVEAAWTAELGRRLDELRAGTAEVLDWSEARARIHGSRS